MHQINGNGGGGGGNGGGANASSHPSQQLCRFGYDCRRPDCWFSHPDGRQIDGNAAPPPSLASLPAHAIAGAGAGNFHLNHSSSSAATFHPAPPAASSAPWASGGHEKKQPVVCRYGRACHRPDCWFSHPEGRSIDDSSSSTSSSSGQMNGIHRSTSDSKELDEEEAVLNQLEAEKGLSVYDVADECDCCGGSPYECTTPECAAQGICNCLLEAADDHNVGTPSSVSTNNLPPWIHRGHSEGDDSWKDEWFPQCRSCGCCEGYVYRCKKQNSACNTQCFCFHNVLVSSNINSIAEESKASLPATVEEQK